MDGLNPKLDANAIESVSAWPKGVLVIYAKPKITKKSD